MAFAASLLLHAMLFLPPLHFSLNIFKKDFIAPPAAVIRFELLAPVPKPELRPQISPEIQKEKGVLPEKKVQPSLQDKLQDLVESVENRRKSKAIKTLVPTKPVDKDQLRLDYALFIQNSIKRHLVYPEEQKDKRMPEYVRVSFCISSEGRLIGKPEIPEEFRSRYESFNSAAIEAVIEASETFPPLPPELGKDSQSFTMPIEFSQ